jgi:hypothetical protein
LVQKIPSKNPFEKAKWKFKHHKNKWMAFLKKSFDQSHSN